MIETALKEIFKCKGALKPENVRNTTEISYIVIVVTSIFASSDYYY